MIVGRYRVYPSSQKHVESQLSVVGQIDQRVGGCMVVINVVSLSGRFIKRDEPPLHHNPSLVYRHGPHIHVCYH